MKIKFIVPFALTADGLANRELQIPRDILLPDTVVDCVGVRNSTILGNRYYADLLFDMYVTEAGLRAEDEGYDAVVMDTVSDSGLAALRSRLSIPVVGPGLIAFSTAVLLGRRFSILTMKDIGVPLYYKALREYGLTDKCASVRAVDVPVDVESLLTGKEEAFTALVEQGRAAIEEDGADVIILGSTTMHQSGDYLRERLPAPVINPGPLALKMAESLVSLDLTHSKHAYPSPSQSHDDKFFALQSYR
jgi:allantoin racemase